MKYLVQILLFLTLAAVATARADDIVETPNTEALGFALCSTEEGQDLTVELDPEAVYTFQPYTREDAKFALFARNCTGILPVITNRSYNDVDYNLTIIGNGARIEGLTLVVQPGARLHVDSVDFDLRDHSRAAIINQGEALIERSSFLGAAFEDLDRARSLAISNDGEMTLRNTIVSGNTTLGVCKPEFSTIHNTGSLDLTHAQIGPNRLPAECESANIYNAGHVVVRRSVIMTQGRLFACAGPAPVVSEGYNFQNFHPCTANLEPTDINLRSNDGNPQFVRVSPSRVAPRFSAGSPAANAVPAALCQGVDFAGSPRTNERCDIGPLTGAGPTPAAFHTLTGTWFDPTADGQYLQFQFPDYDEVLVTWQAFDEAGDNLWLYGLGTIKENVATLDLYRNTGLRLANGQFEGAVEAEPVGSATFTLMACDKATFSFTLGDANGRSTYRRLAFTRGLTCIDPGRR